MMQGRKDSFLKTYRQLLTPVPSLLAREFTHSGYTYGEVFKLAAGIRKNLGVGASPKNICLCSTNKAVVAACVLASLSGSCRVVLPYSFSAHALAEMRETIDFNLAIADHPEEMPPGVDVFTPLPGNDDIHPGALKPPDEPFLYLFTGGSTGRPRIWSKTPRNLLSEAFYLKEKFSLSDRDLFVATVPPYHIYGLLFSVLVPLVSGAGVMPDIYTFPQEIISTVNKHQASVLVSVPIHYRVLKVDNLSVSSLRLAFSSAGSLDRDDSLFFYEKTGLGITEIYGSTETGGVATRSISEKTEAWKPFDVVQWKLSGGRLAVKSDFVSREMTKDQDGFYLTGDEARKERNNRFVLLGRADGIVKVAGKRVDLTDIQNKIKKLPTVNDAAVLHLPTDKGRESIIAAVVACDLTETHLRKLLTDMLEPYAVPRLLKIVPHIPRTAAGKIDRRWLEKLFP